MKKISHYTNEYFHTSFVIAILFASAAHALVITGFAIHGSSNLPIGYDTSGASFSQNQTNRLVIHLAKTINAKKVDALLHIYEKQQLHRSESVTQDKKNIHSQEKHATTQLASNDELTIRREGKTLILESFAEPILIQPSEGIDHTETAKLLQQFSNDNQTDCVSKELVSTLVNCQRSRGLNNYLLSSLHLQIQPISTLTLNDPEILAEIRLQRLAQMGSLALMNVGF